MLTVRRIRATCWRKWSEVASSLPQRIPWHFFTPILSSSIYSTQSPACSVNALECSSWGTLSAQRRRAPLSGCPLPCSVRDSRVIIPQLRRRCISSSLAEPPPAPLAVEPVKLDARIATANNVNANSNIDSTNNSSSSSSTSSASSSSPTGTAAVDPPLPPMESTLSIGSGVDATFLAAFIDATPDTAGAKLDVLMRKVVRPTGPELMGGVHVKRTIRCFIAALLKHLSLVALARRYVELNEGQLVGKGGQSSSSSSQLVDVFKKGGLMHRWMISQRQSLQQLHVAKMQQLEGEGRPMSAEQIAAVDKRLDYEGFCAPLFNKALYLLSVRPCLSHPASRGSHLTATPGLKMASEVSTTLALTRTLSNEVQLVRSNSSGGKAREGAESFLSLFSVYKTLQHFQMYKHSREGRKEGEGETPRLSTASSTSSLSSFSRTPPCRSSPPSSPLSPDGPSSV